MVDITKESSLLEVDDSSFTYHKFANVWVQAVVLSPYLAKAEFSAAYTTRATSSSSTSLNLNKDRW